MRIRAVLTQVAVMIAMTAVDADGAAGAAMIAGVAEAPDAVKGEETDEATAADRAVVKAAAVIERPAQKDVLPSGKRVPELKARPDVSSGLRDRPEGRWLAPMELPARLGVRESQDPSGHRRRNGGLAVLGVRANCDWC